MANAPVKSDARTVSLPLFYVARRRGFIIIIALLAHRGRGMGAGSFLKAFQIVVALIVVKHFDLVAANAPGENKKAFKFIRTTSDC